MKSLQKYICTIFLLMAVITGCNQSNPLPKNLKPTPKPSEQPKPNTKPDPKPDPKPTPKPDTPKPDHKTNEGKGTGDGKTLTVRFSLTDDHGACMFEEMGNVYSATVKTKNAVLTVTTDPPRGVQVLIDGTETKTKTFTFTENGTTQEAQVKVTYNGSVKEYTVKVRYYTGAIKKLIVTDGNGKVVPVQSWGDTTYTAGVETKKVKVEVETIDSADTVKFEGEETKTKEVEFASGEQAKELKAVVTHGGTDETYTIKLYYADPALNPKEPVLTSIVIKNADNPSETFALSPEFLPYNTSYKVKVPASVTKIKIEAAADTGISAEVVNGEEQTLNEGNNPIVVKAIQAANPLNTLSYMIEVRKPKTGASSQAELKSLEMKSKWSGIDRQWITPPAMFNKTIETYECTMDSKCDEFYITASPEDSTATMTVKANDGTLAVLNAGTEWKHTPLKKGMNTFIITVTAEDSVTTKTYTIKAKRAEGSFVLKNFSGTGLNDFYNGRFVEYKKTGNFGSKNFEATVAKTATQTIITAEPEFPDTTTMEIKINGGEKKPFTSPYTLDLTKESPNSPGHVKIELILTSTVARSYFGNQDSYYLAIKKIDGEGDSDNSLERLQVSYYDAGHAKYYMLNMDQTFDPNVTNYTLTIPHGIQDIKVVAEPKSKKAFIEGWNGSFTNVFFHPFTNVTIPVVAQNGSKKEYLITITQREPTSLSITNIPENASINVATGHHQVTGTFNSPDNSVSEIWVGSSGLPIQQDKGGKWVQAMINGTTFTADLTALNELPNGSSDIKAAAFDSANNLVALVRVPITITGSTVPVAPLNVTIKTPPLSSDLSMRITVLDEDWYQKNEDVVYASKVISPIGNLTFPTTIPLTSVKADSNCRVMVSVSQRVGNKDSILYTGLTKIKVEGGKNNNCTVELHRVQ